MEKQTVYAVLILLHSLVLGWHLCLAWSSPQNAKRVSSYRRLSSRPNFATTKRYSQSSQYLPQILYPCRGTSTQLQQAVESEENKGGADDEGEAISNIASSAPPQDIFVIAWDGCLVSTTRRNIEWGLAAAYEVWPELELMTQDADLTWLYNKIEALQHVLAPFDHRYHPAVEYGLAIRMLLEEQELDLGKSNGSKGKYGSKFHPSKECQAFPKRTREIKTKPRQQRPLTVGEIATNWRETLREAAWIRYAQEEERGVNPLDLLQAVIEQQARESRDNPLRVGPDLASILQHQRDDDSLRMVVGVYHEADMDDAFSALADAGLNALPCRNGQEAMDQLSGNGMESPSVVPLIDLNNARTTMKDILDAAPQQSTVRLLESFWCKLQPLTPLFGDTVPRMRQASGEPQSRKAMNGIANSLVPDRQLQLCLCEWTKHCHPNDVASATMNPWTTTWSQDDFLSAVTNPQLQQRNSVHTDHILQ